MCLWACCQLSTEGYYIQTMVFAAVFAANFFNGLNTSAWNGWVFFAVFLGDVLLLVYTVCSLVLDYYSKSNLIYDVRRFTMRFPLRRFRHLFGATTTFCSSRPTFGFVFLSLSSLRYCLGISLKHGNSAFALTMSISSDTLAKWNLTETSRAILRHVIL